MIFVTKYGERKVEFSCPGNRYKIEYELKITKDGQEVLKPCGQTDLQEYIDSFEPSVNLNNILERFERGETDVLEKAKGFYADISELPVKLQDVMNLNKAGQEFFDSLDVDVKEQLGSNYVDFLLNPGKLIEVLNAKEKGELDKFINTNIDDVVIEKEVKEDE